MNTIMNYDLIMNSFNVIINTVENKKLIKVLNECRQLLSQGLIESCVRHFDKIKPSMINTDELNRSISLLRHSIDIGEMKSEVYKTILDYMYDEDEPETEELTDSDYSDDEDMCNESDEDEEVRDDIPDKLMDKIVNAYEELLEMDVVKEYLVVKRFRIKPDMDNIEIYDVITAFFNIMKDVYENIADEDDGLLEVVQRAEELSDLFGMEDKEIKRAL